ncbi:MAG TPA: phytoene desaturase family protein [Novosphingobium sp.]|jgi:phytoene desaturase|nr:phytoene desaturase family protein [Novosphingobium sp.]
MTASLTPLPGKRACVIGAGLGGLALAIRLQAAGVDTVLVEARKTVGGCAWAVQKDGFTFDGGPTAWTDTAALGALWSLTGHDMADDVELLPITPFYRLNWPDGVNFDVTGNEAAMAAEVARIAPGDLEGYEDFLDYAASAYAEIFPRLDKGVARDIPSLLRSAPGFARLQAWRSLHAMAASRVRSDRLREALSVQAMVFGGNPFSTSAVYALAHMLERNGGVWWPKGGSAALAAAMARQFERIGGTLRLHDPVLNIATIGNRAHEVETQSGWRERFDAVASNADLVHSYRDLLGDTVRGPEMARKLVRKTYSPALFQVHFALEGSWPGIQHNTMLMGPRFKGLFEDIFEHGVLPADMLIHLHHPTVTDDTLAPPGKSVMRAMVPVANLGKLPIDWEAVGPLIEKRVLDEVGRRLIPDIHDRIITAFHYSPRDHALDFNAHAGAAFSLAPVRSQSALLRPPNRDARLRNFYLVGAGTHPGAGVPAVVASARATARLMLEDLK